MIYYIYYIIIYIYIYHIWYQRMGKEGIFFTLLGSRPAAPSKICQTLFFPGHVVLDVPKHSVIQHSCTSANKNSLLNDDLYSEQCTGNYVDFFALLIQLIWRRPQKFFNSKMERDQQKCVFSSALCHHEKGTPEVKLALLVVPERYGLLHQPVRVDLCQNCLLLSEDEDIFDERGFMDRIKFVYHRGRH